MEQPDDFIERINKILGRDVRPGGTVSDLNDFPVQLRDEVRTIADAGGAILAIIFIRHCMTECSLDEAQEFYYEVVARNAGPRT